MTDADGTPLAVIVSAANEHDIRFIIPLVFLKFPMIGGLPGRPRTKPDIVRADQGYASQDLLNLLAMADIHAVIPQRGDKTAGLGNLRWPVERTISWLKQFRRIGVRRERLSSIYESLVTLACSLIVYRKLVAAHF